jgi:hypothetical protein
MGLYETKTFLHSNKKSRQTKETAYRMKENLFINPSDKGLITRIFKDFKILTYQRISIIHLMLMNKSFIYWINEQMNWPNNFQKKKYG